jgi:hypothetical protein
MRAIDFSHRKTTIVYFVKIKNLEKSFKNHKLAFFGASVKILLKSVLDIKKIKFQETLPLWRVVVIELPKI